MVTYTEGNISADAIVSLNWRSRVYELGGVLPVIKGDLKGWPFFFL